MTQDISEETRRASKEVLKMIYYIIIALAITESLNKLFLSNIATLYLIVAFLLTICRFAHGASIHLDVYSRKRYKPLFDFLEFFFQAGLFYLMSTVLTEPYNFSLLFITMLLSDAIWLCFLWLIKYIESDKTHKQWLISDIIIIFILSFLLLIPSQTIQYDLYSLIVMITSIIATVTDYSFNKDFYFPSVDNL
ncbi:hypothetical protein LCGC14_1738740 [marine sediment metagenome]|uniref:Uncharacterized protein n=1 Tax=marine sediment metagenome TaxID=412755 RepID=A0A0F9HV06_9ZZZZ